MVADNRPWNLSRNFNAVIAAAFGTGAFALIFPSIYHLTDHASLARMVVVTLLAMSAVLSWIIVSHDLWEPTGHKREALPLAALYNWITVLTLAVAILMAYCVLFAMLLAAAFLLVPPMHLETQPGHAVSFGFYPLLAWLATWVATVASALGSGLENDEEVREVTFGTRQQGRLEQTLPQSDSGSEDGNEHRG